MKGVVALWHARKGQPVRDTAFFAESNLFCPNIEAFTDVKESAFALHSLKCTAPYRDYVPAFVLPSLLVALIALDVIGPFLHPELHVAFGHCRISAAMTVPETAADVDYCTGFGHHNVRSSHETFVADPESPSGGENAFADKNFGLCVPSSYPAHDLASLLWCYPVHDRGRLYHKAQMCVVGKISCNRNGRGSKR